MLEYLTLGKKRLSELYNGLSFICIDNDFNILYATEDFPWFYNAVSENRSLFDCPDFAGSMNEIKQQTDSLSDEKNKIFFNISVSGTEKICLAMHLGTDTSHLILFFIENNDKLCENVSKTDEFASYFTSVQSFDRLAIPIVATRASRIVYCNKAFAEATGYSLLAVFSMRLSKFVSKDSKIEVEKIENGNFSKPFVSASIITQSGSLFNTNIYSSAFGLQNSLVHILYDRKNELHSTFILKMFMSAASYSNDGICIFDTEYNPFWINPSFEKMTGYNIDNLAPIFKYVRQFDGEFKNHITDHEYWYRMDNVETAYGEKFCAEMYIHQINSKYLCLCIENSNEKLQAAQILRSFKTTDYLTGLDNAITFRNQLTAEYEKCATQPDCLSVIMFSVVNYTDIFFTMNPQTADNILKRAAQRAKNFLDNKGHIARLGELRFGIMLRTANDDEAMKFMDDFIGYMDTPIIHQDNSYHLKVCASLCTYPSFASELTTLYSASSTLLNAVIVNKKSGYAYYDAMGEIVIKKYVSAFESEIESSVEKDDFIVQYQPIYSSENANKIIALDALLRTKSERAATNVSRSFLSEADATGAIVLIGYKMLDFIVSHIAQRICNGQTVVPIYFNLSIIQISEDDFIKTLTSTLEKYGVPSSYIILQLKFDDVKHHISELRQKFSELHSLGFEFSITYFTAKATLLESFCKAGVKTLKFSKMLMDPDNADISKRTQMLIDVAKKYDTRIVASGIETMENLDNAMQYGIDCVQGYLFSTPVQTEVIDEMLNKQ